MAIELRLPQTALSEEMLLALSRENPGYRFERSADGRLSVSPPTGLFASDAEGELFFQVRKWTEATDLGRAYPPTAGVTLPDSSIKSADVTYVEYETLGALTPEQKEPAFVHLVPRRLRTRLRTDDISDVRDKIDAYIANGVRATVLIDPATRSVTLGRGRERRICKTDLVEIGDEMPGFVLNAAAIFRIATRRD